MSTTAPEAIEANTAAVAPAGGIAAASLVYLDPRTLAANPANVRSDLGDLSVFLGLCPMRLHFSRSGG